MLFLKILGLIFLSFIALLAIQVLFLIFVEISAEMEAFISDGFYHLSNKIDHLRDKMITYFKSKKGDK